MIFHRIAQAQKQAFDSCAMPFFRSATGALNFNYDEKYVHNSASVGLNDYCGTKKGDSHDETLFIRTSHNAVFGTTSRGL